LTSVIGLITLGRVALVTLDITSGDTRATLAPSRGGMATRFRVGAREVFYLDESTLLDETKNVRGGSPVLFPSPGKLADDRWSRGGRSGALKQHGFARNLAWRVVSHRAGDAALALASTGETRALYPWEFRVTLRYLVSPRALRIEETVTNAGAAPMPFGFGFHPYFAVRQEDKAGLALPTRATRAFDNVSKTAVALSGALDLTRPEVDIHLLDHGTGECALGDIVMRASPEYTHWVVWTLRGKDFVCLEPWTCPGNALNTGDRLLELAPGASRELWVEYALASA
jgi:galactose mutarotase-like enzyme